MDLVLILVCEVIGPSAYRGVMGVTYRDGLADGVAGKRRGKEAGAALFFFGQREHHQQHMSAPRFEATLRHLGSSFASYTELATGATELATGATEHVLTSTHTMKSGQAPRFHNNNNNNNNNS
jgi:hypothetical protein